MIEKVNDLFKGQLSNQDKLIDVNNITQGKLPKSEKVKQQATHHTKEQFANSPDLNNVLLNASMATLDAHNAMSTQALGSEKARHGIKDILMNHTGLYETLRTQATDESAPGYEWASVHNV